MTQISVLINKPSGYIVGFLILALIVFIIFRKDISALLKNSKMTEFFNGFIKIKSGPKKNEKMQSDSLGKSKVPKPERSTKVDFGEKNKYKGNWENVSIGGDVSTSRNSQKTNHSSKNITENKVDE